MIESMMTGEMARIFFKDGNLQTGLLLNDIDNPETFEEGVKYIPHDKLSVWFESFSVDHIKVVEPELVDGIDVFMK